MTTGGNLRDRLASLAGVSDDQVPLGDTALTIAGFDRPAAYLEDYLPHFAALAEDLDGSGQQSATAGDRALLLADVMVRRHCYRADYRDDEDTSNTNLMWVIDNRRGVAEALGILALEASRRNGWNAEGLAFPAHFLLRLDDESGGRVIVDPMLGWRVVEPPELRSMLKASAGLSAELTPDHYAALSNRDILLRLLSEAKVRLLRCGCLAQALAAVETALLFAPGRALLWREAGLLHMRLDQPAGAIAALEQFVNRTTNDHARRRAQQLLQELKSRLR